MSPHEEKQALRRRLVDARRSLEPGYRAEAAPRLHQRVLALPEVLSARRVLLYASRGAEVPMEALATALVMRGIAIGVPRIEGEELLPCPIGAWRDLVPGAFGIHTSLAPPWTGPIDVALVPGVGFDATGGRLGLGRGFYDRLLGTGQVVCAVGVGWDVQHVDCVPVDARDRPVDILVTQSVTLRRTEAITPVRWPEPG